MKNNEKVRNFAVIGAGPVGIYLSAKLLAGGHQVTLIESGYVKSESEILNKDNYIQKSPTAIPNGVHKVGGGSNLWHGRIGEFIQTDFIEIPGMREEKWPFTLSELRPFYDSLSLELDGNSINDSDLINSLSS